MSQTINKIDKSTLSIDSLNTRIVHLIKVAKIPGVAISIFNENNVVFRKTYGFASLKDSIPLNQCSIFYSASFSKMIFAYVVMKLVDEKVIDLDTPLVNYLSAPLPTYKLNGLHKGYKHLQNDNRHKLITARMCLTHTTGFPNWRWYESDKKLKFKFTPGTRYSYSGEGLYLLQFIVEQITGNDYESIAQKMVFKPLGMSNSSYVWQNRFDTNTCYGHNSSGGQYQLMKWKEPNASGSMSTTLEDFTKFYSALLNNKGLSSTSYKEMISQQIRIYSKRQFGPLAETNCTNNDNISLGYGLGVGTFSTPYGTAFFKEGHDDGWGHYSICYPDKKVGIVIMTNSDNGEGIFKDLLEYSIGDKFTPWQWENYIPYYEKD